MALADYFSKNLLAISQVINSGTNEEFRSALDACIVGIAFDDDVKKLEGKAALDLIIRLLSRLYPKLKLINLSSNPELDEKIISLSKSINSKIEFVDEETSVIIAIGKTQITQDVEKGPVFYVGSDGWISKFSNSKPIGCGNTLIPYGVGFAACVGVANIFRYSFRGYIKDVKFDDEFSLSLIDLSAEDLNFEWQHVTLPSDIIDLGDFVLAGFGAIGNGAIWALHHSSFIKGQLTVVEPENIDVTNLQRYILAEERHIGQFKNIIAQETLKSTTLILKTVNDTWSNSLNRSAICSALVAIDSAKGRIEIQSSLPKEIINSYTGDNLVGISRHFNFSEKPCLACLYMPEEETKNYSQEVADQLGIKEQQIRDYLYYNLPADEPLLKLVARANSINYDMLEKFKGLPAQQFYASLVCGGALLDLKEKNNSAASLLDAPLAHQSALAGILLISEFIIHKAGLRSNSIPTKTHFHPMYPINKETNPHTHSTPRDTSGRCICSDDDFIYSYKLKWNFDR